MKNFILLSALVIFGAISANAQVAKMASVYTNLKTDCKPETKIEADEVPFICKAVGGFRVRIVPAGAWAESIEIVDSKGKTITSLGTHGYGFSVTGKRMLEWRMANGKPFAVILRTNKYDMEKATESGDNPYSDKYKIGEKLLIRGLEGHSQIDFEVDTKEKNANAKSQKMADENFQ
jgi:hypothetical protein